MRQGAVTRLLLLCLVAFSASIVQALVVPAVALYAAALGASAGVIGTMIALGFAIPLTLAVGVGRMVDAIGARHLVLSAFVLLTVAPFVALLAPSLTTLTVLVALVNVAHVGAIVASQREVARVGVLRSRGFGWYTTFVAVGQLLGPLAMGWSLEVWGFAGALGFASALATIGLVSGAAFAHTSPASASTSGHTARGVAAPAESSEISHRAPVMLSMVASAGVLFTMGVHQTFFPLLLDDLGARPVMIGVILSARALAAIVVRPFLATVTRVVGSSGTVLAACLALAAFGIGAPALAATELLALICSFAVGVGSGLAQPLSMVLVSDHTPSHRHGVMLGVRMAVNYAALASAALLVGPLVSLAGFGAAFGGAALVPGGLAISTWRARRALDVPADDAAH